MARESALAASLANLRLFFRLIPFLLLLVVICVSAIRVARGRMERGRAARNALFLVSVLAIGPGLLVNAGLKAHSHRPRPVQTFEAGGGAFRPFFRFDGACARNCSFSSGEAAAAFWTAGPALLTPAPLRLAATAAALGFGAGASALRMAAGAHYLSDVAFSAFLVLSLTLLARRLILRPEGRTPVDRRCGRGRKRRRISG